MTRERPATTYLLCCSAISTVGMFFLPIDHHVTLACLMVLAIVNLGIACAVGNLLDE